MDDLFKKYFDGTIDPRTVVESMWGSSSSRSYIKGAVVECAFKKVVSDFGWSADKVEDQDNSKRYDFDVASPTAIYRFEVKTLMPNLKVDIGYRDYREVALPTRKLWKTKSRKVSEDFDYMAVCLVNYDGFFIKDFLYVSFNDLNRLIVKDKKGHEFTEEERFWIQEEYIDSRVVVPSLSPSGTYFNDLSMIESKTQ